jgi:hypothetical protein
MIEQLDRHGLGDVVITRHDSVLSIPSLDGQAEQKMNAVCKRWQQRDIIL